MRDSTLTDYERFCRATRPGATTVLSLLVTFALMGRYASRDGTGIDATTVFYATVLVLSAAFSLPSGGGVWVRVLWPVAPPIETVGWIVGTASLAVVTGFIQGALLPGRVTTSDPPFLLLFVLAPVVESILFQGWLQTMLSGRLGKTVAASVTAVAFFSIHLQSNLVVLVGVIALCYIRMRSGSLGTVILTHMACNIAMFTVDAIAR